MKRARNMILRSKQGGQPTSRRTLIAPASAPACVLVAPSIADASCTLAASSSGREKR